MDVAGKVYQDFLSIHIHITQRNYCPPYRTYKPIYLGQIYQILDRPTGGKWLIHVTEHRRENQSQTWNTSEGYAILEWKPETRGVHVIWNLT